MLTWLNPTVARLNVNLPLPTGEGLTCQNQPRHPLALLPATYTTSLTEPWVALLQGEARWGEQQEGLLARGQMPADLCGHTLASDTERRSRPEHGLHTVRD